MNFKKTRRRVSVFVTTHGKSWGGAELSRLNIFFLLHEFLFVMAFPTKRTSGVKSGRSRFALLDVKASNMPSLALSPAIVLAMLTWSIRVFKCKAI